MQCCNICSYHRVINENNFCKLLPLAEFFIRNMKTRKFELMLMRGVSRLISSPRTNIFHTLLVCRLHWFWIDYTILSTYIYKSSCTHVNIKGTRIILVTRGLQQLTLQCPAFIKTLLWIENNLNLFMNYPKEYFVIKSMLQLNLYFYFHL